MRVGYVSLVVGSLLVYLGVVLSFPEHVRNEVISEITLAYLTIEGILLGMVSLVEERQSRVPLVVLGVVAITLSLTTLTIAKFQSIQLGWSSWLSTTALFKANGGFFLVFVKYYAFGLLPREPRNPAETDP